ncbi:MAG TPA: hypothetical protein VI844_00740, partial [Coxiellaceae bacterium]|nr:hypothetical protein [Coxiellaceae bacterium]
AVNKLLILAGYLTGFDVTHENSASQHQEIASLQRTVTALSLRDISAHARTQAPAEKSKKKKSEFRFLIDQLLAMRNSQLAGKATSFIDASVKSITKFSLLRNDAISDLIYGCFGLFVSSASAGYDFLSGRAAVIGARKVFASHCSGKSAQIMLTFLLSTAAGIIRLVVLNASEENANENVLILAAVFSGLAGFLGNARMDSLPGRVGQFFSENGGSDHMALPAEPSTAEEEMPRITISAPIVQSEEGTPLASRHVTHLIPPAPPGRHAST